jgi:hypothetical protein
MTILGLEKKHLIKLKKVFAAGMPSGQDFSMFIKGMILVFVVLTGVTIFNAVSTANAQDKPADNVMKGATLYITDAAGGCLYTANKDFAPVASTTGYSAADIALCEDTRNNLKAAASNSAMAVAEIDYGTTGRILNAGASLYDTQMIQPGATAEYYASNIKGTTYAADDPTSGRSFLAPIFMLNQLMVNLAYGLVVVVLLFSSLNILLSSLTGGEERYTLVQLLANAAVTLIAITFYYEIAAIVYDLTVNYGNALVAGILTPYINSQVILERLSPGGDISVVVMLNTFELHGISDTLNVVAQNITSGLYPALSQSAIALNRALTTAHVLQGDAYGAAAAVTGFGGAISSVGISAVVSSFLGNKEIFDAIIAWAILFINLKIFVNLITSSITIHVYAAIGPMISLGAIKGGFGVVGESYKNLFAVCAVFPLTFLLILMGAIAMNIFIRPNPGTSTDVDTGAASVLCKYGTGDPTSTAEGTVNRDIFTSSGAQLLGQDLSKENPKEFRVRNTLNQRVYDVTPANVNGGVRDCRPALFQSPFAFIPAPFGNIGNRMVQIQTIDSLIRTFLGIIFLIMAGRAPRILDEALGIKKMGFLNGIGGAFKQGAESFFAVGGAAVSMGMPIATGLLKGGVSLAGRAPLAPFARGDKSVVGGYLSRREAKKTAKDVRKRKIIPNDPVAYAANPAAYKGGFSAAPGALDSRTRVNDVLGSFGSRSRGYTQAVQADAFARNKGMLIGAGASPVTADRVAGQQLMASMDKLKTQFTALGTAMQALTTHVEKASAASANYAGQIKQLSSILQAIDSV